MSELYSTVSDWFANPAARSAARAIAILLVGLLLARLVKRRLVSGLRGQERLLASRILGGLILGLSVTWALSELGLSLSVVLGAAGVLTIAVGFAAQTAISNLISGLFLIIERPFRIGDVIEIGSTVGEVVVIDLMSTKLRTFDNLLVRIPNEVLLKAEVKNLTHFPIRRIDLELRLAPESDLERLRELLFSVTSSIHLCLDEPRPSLVFLGFDDSGARILLTAWAASGDYLAVKNEFHARLAHAMREADIEIGVPQRKMVAA